jgi:hypothetical protein
MYPRLNLSMIILQIIRSLCFTACFCVFTINFRLCFERWFAAKINRSLEVDRMAMGYYESQNRQAIRRAEEV